MKLRLLSKRLYRGPNVSIARALAIMIILFALAQPPFTAAPSDESIDTFAPNCTTLKDAFNLGDTVCAVATGAPLPVNGFRQRRFEWVAPDGSVARHIDITTDPQSDPFILPLSGPFAQVGTWIVKTIDNSADGFAIARFVVRNPNLAAADLSVVKIGPEFVAPGSNLSYTVMVINRGPDTAENVVLTDPVPGGTTFVSSRQDTGPAFSCTDPTTGGGASTCTIAALPPNGSATFEFVYNLDAGTPDGSIITNTVTVSSSTAELHEADNTSTAVTNTRAGFCTLSCPNDISTTNEPGQCGRTVSYNTPTGSGSSCGVVECNPPSGALFPVGTTFVVCAGDTGSPCSFRVIVEDTEVPTITCPANVSVFEDSPGSGSAIVGYASPVVTDNCPTTITCEPASGSAFNVGTTTVTCQADDGSGNTASCSFTVTVTGTGCNISCPSNIITQNSPDQCGAIVDYPAPTASESCGVVECSPASGAFFPVGTTTVTCTSSSGSRCRFNITVLDVQAPTIICPPPVSAVANFAEECSAVVSPGLATVMDNCSGVTVIGIRSDDPDLALDAAYPPGVTTINWIAVDASGNQATCSSTVTVTNPAPVVTITGPASGSIFAVGTAVSFTGSFTDNPGGTHTAEWSFDALTEPGIIESTGTVTASFTFTTTGIYSVKLRVDDGCGGSGTATTVNGVEALVVIYDPQGQFVTGGGWFNSPAGAYQPNPALTGKANFGLNAKYKNGATVPSGETEFQLKGAGINFHSTAYEYLVIEGPKAHYRGSGKINGSGDYGFIITLIDGQEAGGGGADKFRIKIWDKNNNNAVVYDTQLNAPDEADPTTLLGGGSLVIHK
jgi:uncharacterized repeat protein (TIGR01451 family)